MDYATLGNLFRWSLQVALLTIAGAAALRVLRIDAPTIRHAFWRALLLLCLALPVVQPWQHPAPLTAGAIEQIDFPAFSGIVTTVTAGSPSQLLTQLIQHLRRNWVTWVNVILVAGAIARIVWLGLGVFRLRQLRRSGASVTPGGHHEVLDLIRARADIRYVKRLGQPVTFGVFRAVVLLPDAFPTLPWPVQRAVLAHELWHVRRRDWAWVLLEEAVRALLWFNPAIWWLISRVQSTREEVVDELTVQVTHARKVYLEALLAFADRPTLFPAAPFARRRHLFDRMLLISREAVMSSRRIAITSITALAAVACTAWSGAAMFPLHATSAYEAGQNLPPRDRRPGQAGPETTRERDLKAEIAANQANKDPYLQLATLQDARGARDQAEATLEAMGRAFANDPDALTTLAQAYVKSGRFSHAVSALDSAVALDPTNPGRHHILAVFHWEKAFKDKSLPPDEVRSHIRAGLAAEDKALGYSPDFVEALVYKNILLRMQANLESDPATKQALIAEADALRGRAMALNKAGSATGSMAFVPRGEQAGAAPPPPPPPPPPAETVDGVVPVRIGGELKPPRKLVDVKPTYPVEAQAARIQGVVIIEAVINAVGTVVNTRVLRGVPMLDDAAVGAVSQWQFEPTLLNGVPVPVVMTVTVNFTLEGR